MRFTSAAVAAVCLLSATENIEYGDAFTVTQPMVSHSTLTTIPQVNHQMGSRKQGRPLHFKIPSGGEPSGGMEELLELTDNKMTSAFEKQVQKAPSFFKLAGYATIPVSAALGFGIVPSRRLAAHAAGAIITGVAGAVGKSKLDSVTESAALPAIAQTIIDHGIEDPATTFGYVKSLKESHGIIDEDDFQLMCADVYSKYLLGMVKFNPMPKSSEPKELAKLKSALGLDNLLVGEAHAAAADEWYRTTCLFTPEEDLDDPDHPDRQAMDKFLFLTERALKQGNETDEAFRFEMARVAKSMKLSLMDAMFRVADVQQPFYARALVSTRAKLGEGKVSGAMLERARQTLGIDEDTAHDMHISCFNDEVRAQLGLAERSDEDDDDSEAEADATQAKFATDAEEHLALLAEILGISEDDANYEIVAETTPSYQATALSSMNAVLSGVVTPDEAWEKIDARRRDLLLPEDRCDELLSSMVIQSLGGPLEKANKFAKVNNEVAVYENLLEALDAKQALIKILAKSGWDDVETFDSVFCDPWEEDSAISFIDSTVRNKLYNIFIKRTFRNSADGKISDEMHSSIKSVQGLLAVTDEQSEYAYNTAFGPELQKACLLASEEITKDYTPELAEKMSSKINQILDDFKLSDSFLKNEGASCYNNAVKAISAKSPGGIPTKELNEALEALRVMYKLDMEDIYQPHLESFGEVYKKSILEAMGSTGVITPELQEGLADLRSRLGVREEDTKDLYLSAIEKKFVPMMQWVNNEMERTQLTQKQLSDRRGKDMGEDVFQTGKAADGTLGLGAEVNIMGDIINLVDFYTENNIAEEVEIGTKEVDGEEVPVLETSYPITGIGSDVVDQQMAEYLYRQFVVGAFSAQGEQAGRYEAARASFGGILGLSSEKMEEINDSIGSAVYDNFVSRSMTTKGALDQQDMMFLANIQTKLGLSSEAGEKLMMDSQRKFLTEELSKIMDDETPERIKAFREKCNGMGLDLSEDLGITKHQLVTMFEKEITPALKAGEITEDDQDILAEIQESLNIDSEECEAVFFKTVLRLAQEALNEVEAELLRGREENTVDLIAEIVRYAAFFGGDLDFTVEEPTAWSIYNVYEAVDFSGEDAEVVEDNKELLQVALGLMESEDDFEDDFEDEE
mmetsp:Transcript_28553/g.77273  ORF Transcript_28553/g.77273 Transcript_28553/m.77273 type:complete len:1142 (+) Transcript_28553:196-3621(+)